MRGKVPEDVDVGLHQPEVDAHRVDEQDLAQHTVGYQLRDALHGRRVAVGVVAHQDEAALLGRLDHPSRLGSRPASGFSTRTCLPASSAARAIDR